MYTYTFRLNIPIFSFDINHDVSNTHSVFGLSCGRNNVLFAVWQFFAGAPFGSVDSLKILTLTIFIDLFIKSLFITGDLEGALAVFGRVAFVIPESLFFFLNFTVFFRKFWNWVFAGAILIKTKSNFSWLTCGSSGGDECSCEEEQSSEFHF